MRSATVDRSSSGGELRPPGQQDHLFLFLFLLVDAHLRPDAVRQRRVLHAAVADRPQRGQPLVHLLLHPLEHGEHGVGTGQPEVGGRLDHRRRVDAERARYALQRQHGVLVAGVHDAHPLRPVDAVRGAQYVNGRAALVPRDGRLALDGQEPAVWLEPCRLEYLDGPAFQVLATGDRHLPVVVRQHHALVLNPSAVAAHLVRERLLQPGNLLLVLPGHRVHEVGAVRVQDLDAVAARVRHVLDAHHRFDVVQRPARYDGDIHVRHAAEPLQHLDRLLGHDGQVGVRREVRERAVVVQDQAELAGARDVIAQVHVEVVQLQLHALVAPADAAVRIPVAVVVAERAHRREE